MMISTSCIELPIVPGTIARPRRGRGIQGPVTSWMEGW